MGRIPCDHHHYWCQLTQSLTCALWRITQFLEFRNVILILTPAKPYAWFFYFSFLVVSSRRKSDGAIPLNPHWFLTHVEREPIYVSSSVFLFVLRSTLSSRISVSRYLISNIRFITNIYLNYRYKKFFIDI